MNATSLPHVVLVLTDQQSVWTLSSYHRALGTHHASYADFPSSSSAPLQTPSLDALAARGALFTNFVVASPACVPSRYSLLTSIDPLCCRQKPRDDACAGGDAMRHTLGHELARASYATFYLGKWHLGHDRTGNPVQWDDGTLPPGTAGFAHTRYMIADVNHPKTMVDVDEEAAAGGVPTILRHAELDGAPSKGAADECDPSVRWENSATTTTLLSYDVPCTNPERHYATNFSSATRRASSTPTSTRRQRSRLHGRADLRPASIVQHEAAPPQPLRRPRRLPGDDQRPNADPRQPQPRARSRSCELGVLCVEARPAAIVVHGDGIARRRGSATSQPRCSDAVPRRHAAAVHERPRRPPRCTATARR